jgi:hypothetical protein
MAARCRYVLGGREPTQSTLWWMLPARRVPTAAAVSPQNKHKDANVSVLSVTFGSYASATHAAG